MNVSPTPDRSDAPGLSLIGAGYATALAVVAVRCPLPTARRHPGAGRVQAFDPLVPHPTPARRSL